MIGMSPALATISVLIKACVNSRYQATFHPLHGLGTRLIQSINTQVVKFLINSTLPSISSRVGLGLV